MRTRHRGAALWLGLLPTLAWAQLVLPPEPVSPDGFDVSSPAAVTATGAQVTRAGPDVFRVVPERGARQVAITAGGQTKTLKVGPPVTTVSLSVTPGAPVKSKDTSAVLEIGLGAGSAPPVVRANVGRIEGLERTGPGKYRARYVLPETRYPEVAIIVAFSAWPHPQSVHGAFGVLRVPLASAVELPGRTEPNGEIRLTIAGQTFGPARAGADGSFRLPVTVPPGYGTAAGVTVDPIGNKRSSKIDLMLPPTDQLACVVTPTRLPADGVSKARVLCATSDRFGAVARGAKVVLTAKTGKLSAPRDLGDGVLEWTLVAPTERGGGVETLRAEWRQGAVDSREELSIELAPGPVARLSPAPEVESLVHLGSTWEVTLEARDALGRPTPGAQVKVSAPSGEARADPVSAAGTTSVRWRPAPGQPLGEAPLRVVAFGPFGTEPARLRAWTSGNELFAAVTDLAELPVADQRVLLATNGDEPRALVTGADGTVSLGALRDGVHELRHSDWPGLRLQLLVRGGKLVFPIDAQPPRVELERRVRVAPELPVNVRVVPERGGATWWLEASDGSVIEDREVVVATNGQAVRAKSHGRTRVSLAEGTVAVIDVATRVSAIAEVGR